MHRMTRQKDANYSVQGSQTYVLQCVTNVGCLLFLRLKIPVFSGNCNYKTKSVSLTVTSLNLRPSFKKGCESIQFPPDSSVQFRTKRKEKKKELHRGGLSSLTIMNDASGRTTGGAGGSNFIPTQQLLSNDGVLVGRGGLSSQNLPFGGSGLNAARSTLRSTTGERKGGLPTGGGGGGNGIIHDNYLTGRLLVQASSLSAGQGGGASDPGDLHSLPSHMGQRLPPLSSSNYTLPTAVVRHGLQITAAARSCSGELVAVPHLSGSSPYNPSATHPSIDGGKAFDDRFIFRGFVSPTARTIPDEVDAMIRGEVDAAQAAAAKAAQINKWATIIQSLVRMRFARRRYLLHRQRLTAVLLRVFYERQMRCALLIQKNAKRMVARHRYLRLRDALWQKGIAVGAGVGGTGGKKKSSVGLGGLGSSGTSNGPQTKGPAGGAAARAVQNRRSSFSGLSGTTGDGANKSSSGGKPLALLPNEPYPWLDNIAERNFTFVVALKAMIDGRLEEAKHAFETFSQHSGQQGGDKVALRLAHCCDARLRTIANLANGGKEVGGGSAGDKKGTAGAKGKSQSPARRR